MATWWPKFLRLNLSNMQIQNSKNPTGPSKKKSHGAWFLEFQGIIPLQLAKFLPGAPRRWDRGWGGAESCKSKGAMPCKTPGNTLPKTHIAIENPPFWWYLEGNMGISMGYVSFREGSWPYYPWLWSPPWSPKNLEKDLSWTRWAKIEGPGAHISMVFLESRNTSYPFIGPFIGFL